MTTVPAGRSQAEKVLAIVEAAYGPGAEIRMDFDWFGHGPQAAIVWEEGPYEWTLGILDRLREAERVGRIWCEPGTAWFLNVYQEV